MLPLPYVVQSQERQQVRAGDPGYITVEMFKGHLPPAYADHEYFICGPDMMMDAIEKGLDGLGVAISKYHSERYSFV